MTGARATASVQTNVNADAGAVPEVLDMQTIRQVVIASSAGTVIEWYDFFVFGTLAPIMAPLFFPSSSETAAFLNTLATFGAGFAVRPLGALVFGRIGDMVGRKYAFMLTLLIMGCATAAIGLLPSVSSVGITATIMLVVLRLLQGLALGGEYGGAAIYVAEHAPANRRGYFTSFIQATATLGLLVSLVVILGTRALTGEAAFKAWGWRIPFLLSALLVVMSYYIRRSMAESPVFAKMKAEGTVSRMPIREAFGTPERWKIFLSVLFGVVAGQAVVFYTGQFFALFFIQKVLKLSLTDSYVTVAIGIVLGTPFYLLSGALSDRTGRKRMIISGLFLAALGNYENGTLASAREMLTHPACIPALGDGGAHYGAICDASYSTFLLAHWCRDTGADRIPLSDAVHMLTQKAARAVGLNDRGLLRPGYKADVNIIDMDRLAIDLPTIVHDLPAGGRRLDQSARGYDATIVSGQVIRRHDAATDALPGRLVRGAQAVPV